MKYIWTGDAQGEGWTDQNNWSTEMNNDQKICKICCAVFSPENDKRFRITNGIGTVVLVFFGWVFVVGGVVLLGIIFFGLSLWTMLLAINGKKSHQCPTCGNSVSIPLECAEGRRLFQKTKMLDNEPRHPLEPLE